MSDLESAGDGQQSITISCPKCGKEMVIPVCDFRPNEMLQVICICSAKLGVTFNNS